MMTRALLPFAVALLLAVDQPTQDTKAELDKLQGDWTMVSREINGKKAPDAVISQSKLTIKGEQWTVTTKGLVNKVTFKIDPSKDPKAIDMNYVGPLGKDNRWVGIYKLEGDLLTLCRAPAERPKEFKSTNAATMVMVWKRAGK